MQRQKMTMQTASPLAHPQLQLPLALELQGWQQQQVLQRPWQLQSQTMLSQLPPTAH
jgi:hypothetical protein